MELMNCKNAIGLVADIGGTNTRLAFSSGATVLRGTNRRFRNQEFSDVDDLISKYLSAEKKSYHPNSISSISLCAAVAGPVFDNRSSMTNIDWEIDAGKLQSRFGFSNVSIINDLQALGHSLHMLSDSDAPLLHQGGNRRGSNTKLVVNIGTGFNCAVAHNTPYGRIVAPSECGHTDLAVRCDDEWSLYKHLRSDAGIATLEDVLSGPGLTRVHAWLHNAGASQSASEISQGFGRDKDSDKTGVFLTKLLGRVVGNFALIHLPYDGIFLTGSVAKALGPHLKRFGFVEAFTRKGEFSSLVSQFPVRIVNKNFAALLGCAEFQSSVRTETGGS